MNEKITIRVGELKHLKFGFLRKLKLMYAGMPNEHTFSLAPLFHQGHSGFSPNIFYDIHATSIFIQNYQFKVVQVDKEKIILKVLKD